MTLIFDKLNLKDQKEILVLNAPVSFEPELAALRGVTVLRETRKVRGMDFILSFVTTQREVDDLAKAIAGETRGDTVVWFAYPKAASKKYKCEFNRDSGWDVLGRAGFEGVRQVAIDQDWSALRFRRVEFIKTMTRRASLAMTRAGKARTKE
jgi:hypothetical protein